MATGRTIGRWARFYADGYDWSGVAEEFGPVQWQYAVAPARAVADAGVGGLPDRPTVMVGSVKGLFFTENPGGFLTQAGAGGVTRNILIPMGIRAAPAQGDPVFMGQFIQTGTMREVGNGAVYLNCSFGVPDVSALLNYSRPFGWLLHAKGAETAVNSAIGIDDNGAASTYGGYLMYHIFSANGTATVKVQDAASNLNASFADLAGATSGVVDASSTPKSGIVQLATNATVRQFLRWQIVLGTATTLTFALAFVRALRSGD